MTKSPVKKTSPTDKKIAALVKRMKALEGQSFAQQLLIDDLESRLEQAEKIPETVWNVPYQSTLLGTHVCQGGCPDLFGTVICLTCGNFMYTITTTVSSDTVTTADTSTSLDNIDITWTEPWTITDSETKE